jgi:hypothetical protein
MPGEFTLEIYGSGETDVPLAAFRSDNPFPTISKGDLVNPVRLAPHTSRSATMLRVTRVEHILWELNGDPKHKVCVYTAEVADSPSLRHPR